ncbi:MAG: hypothetical protein JWM28_573 [Chitinophagaceae bacterium]|nr:hypothetical protein [Chitinophagaceae bacterium]
MKDNIANQAYTELMISCQSKGCVEDFTASVEQCAREPIEEWALYMAAEARKAGWESNEKGKVFCPAHSPKILESK